MVLFGVLGWRSYAATGITGDEPHYLVIAHSLLADGDLQIENNHLNHDYRLFFGGTLRPDYLRRGSNGQIYSIHAPGIPVLVMPAYAIGGARGAILLIAMLGALATLAVFKLAEQIGGRVVAWLTWTAVSLTVPVLPHAWSLYPEAGALAIVAWAALWIASSSSAPPAVWAVRGLTLAVLPWLHTKMVVFLAAFVVCLIVRLRRERVNAVAALAPIAVSVAAWLAFFYATYGTFDPQAPYGGSVSELRLANIPRSLLGLLTDQKFGLLVYAPVYAFAIPGAWLMWRDARYRGAAVGFTLTALAFAVSSGRLYMWWGGSSAPARFLVPILPLLAPMLAFAFSRLRGPVATGALAASLAFSLAVAVRVLADLDERLLFSDPRGVSRFVEAVQGSAPLTAALPTFTQEDWSGAVRQVLPWATAAIAALAAARLLRRRTVFASVSLQASLFVFVGSILAGAVPAEARAASAARGSAALLHAFDPVRARAFDFSRMAKLAPAAWLSASRIDVRLDAQVIDPQATLVPLAALPAGRYDVQVVFPDDVAYAGDLELLIRRGQVLRRVAGPLRNPVRLSIDVPVTLPAAWLQFSERATAQAAERVEIVPASIVPRGDRPPYDAIAADVVAGPPGAYMVYADNHTYPEGGVFWTRGTERGQVVVAPGGASTIALTLRTGADALVRVAIGNAQIEEHVTAGEVREVTVPVPAGSTWVLLAVESSAAFQPAEVDPASSDTRSLGCQVRVELR
jgi:hypothetical protein